MNMKWRGAGGEDFSPRTLTSKLRVVAVMPPPPFFYSATAAAKAAAESKSGDFLSTASRNGL